MCATPHALPPPQAYTAFKASLYHAEALAQVGKALHSEGAVGKAVSVLRDALVHLKGTKEVRGGSRALGECPV